MDRPQMINKQPDYFLEWVVEQASFPGNECLSRGKHRYKFTDPRRWDVAGAYMAQNNSEQLRYDGQAMLVTGSGRGLGREYALLLASRGAAVVVADKGGEADGGGASASPADSVVSEIVSQGGKAVAFHADLSEPAGATDAVDATVKAFGRIDGIIHNAGIASPSESVEQVSSDDFIQMVRLNTFAGFWMAKRAWPHMKQQGGGRILLTSSSALYGSARYLAYSAAKSSFIGLGRALAWEGEPLNIFTNVLVPSAATRLNPRDAPSAFNDWYRETLRSEKIAPVAAYLCHASCRYNGEIVAVSGERIARIRVQESVGDIGPSKTIEDVADRMAAAMGGEEHFYPKDTRARTEMIGVIMGAPAISAT